MRGSAYEGPYSALEQSRWQFHSKTVSSVLVEHMFVRAHVSHNHSKLMH